MREPLLAPLAALAAGIVASRLAEFQPRELIVALALLSILTLLASRYRFRRTAVTAVLVVVAFSGSLLVLLHRPTPVPIINTDPHETVVVEGCVVEPPIFSGDRQRFVVELAPQARARVTLYLKEGEHTPQLSYGQRVDIEGRVRRPHNFDNPGSFDYTGYLARRHIFWNISVSSPEHVRLLPCACGDRFHAAVYRLRGTAIGRLEQLYGKDSREIAMLRAILLGESSQLRRVWKDQFRRTGTYHTLVVSGLHVTVLAAIFLFLFRLLGLPRSWTLVVVTLIAWGYAILTGCNTSVIRSASGLSLYLIAGYFFRQRRLLNILAAIAIVFLVIDPEQLFEAGFQFSFLAVAMIGAFAAPLLERTTAPYRRALRGLGDVERDHGAPSLAAQFRVELRLLAETVRLYTPIPERWTLTAASVVLHGVYYLADLTVVSAVIQVGLLLPMVRYFHRVSWSGLLANPVVIPLMSLAVPVGFLAVATGWSLPVSLAGALTSLSLRVVTWFAHLEPEWRVPDPPLWLAMLFVSSLVIAAVAIRLRNRLKWAAYAGSSLCGIVLLLHPFAPRVKPGCLELTAVDVGQGESLFLALPGGKTLVVDGGGIPLHGRRMKPELDLGEDVVSPYLWTRSIRHVDVLVSTHGHEDHIDGLFALLENFHPNELWVGAASRSTTTEELKHRARKRGVRVRILHAGCGFEFGGARVKVLSPAMGDTGDGQARNDNSLVFRLSYGRHSFLLTGDMERRVEQRLIRDGVLRRTDVLKVPHHGSRTSSTPAFLDRLRPGFAVVSAGFENPYRFPHTAVLRRLAQTHTAVFQTDRDGLVTIRTDGKRFSITTRRWPVPASRRFARQSVF